MIRRISHVGVAVRDIKEAIDLFTNTLGFKKPTPIFGAPEIGLKNAMIPVGDNFEGCKIELMESTDPTKDVGRFLEKRGEGLYHICIEVDDVEAEIKSLKAKGVDVLDVPPSQSAPYRRGFIRRKDAKGVLFELVPYGRTPPWLPK